MVKVIYNKPTTNILSDKNQKDFPKSGTRQGSLLALLFSITLEVLGKGGKRDKRDTNWKRGSIIVSIANDRVINTENPTDFTNKLLENNTRSRYKSCYISIANKLKEKNKEEKKPNYNCVTKNCLEIKLANEVKDFSIKHYVSVNK